MPRQRGGTEIIAETKHGAVVRWPDGVLGLTYSPGARWKENRRLLSRLPAGLLVVDEFFDGSADTHLLFAERLWLVR
jgi:hypothetical protein